MISENQVKKYCREDISLIENYEKAINDKTQTWDCHHRKESQYSVDELVDIGEYYNRPACELIFLTPANHRRFHHLGKQSVMSGKHHSAETCKKISEANKGKRRSAEARKKMSESKKGENHPLFGKHHSEESRKKIAEALKGKPNCTKCTNWYNNGVKNIRAKTCPEGFVPGRIVCKKRS